MGLLLEIGKEFILRQLCKENIYSSQGIKESNDVGGRAPREEQCSQEW